MMFSTTTMVALVLSISLHRSWLVLTLLLGISTAWAEPLTGLVVGIADGDTITVLDSSKTQHKVRLAGIDAPEKAQPFGDKSKANLSRMVFNQNVSLDCRKIDRYKREVCVVLLNGQDVNLEQVKAGLAWWYREYRREQSLADQGYYEYAEFDAKAQRRGLWADADPMPPWEWRKRTHIEARLD
jgi:endonuclease YncB( thermonuclease family)